MFSGHTPANYSFHVRFNIILSPTLISSERFLSFIYYAEYYIRIQQCSHERNMFCQSHPPLITLNRFLLQSMKLPVHPSTNHFIFSFNIYLLVLST